MAIAKLTAALALTLGAMHGAVSAADSTGAAALRAQYAALAPKLAHNQFQQPLHLESSETSRGAKGEIFAVVDYPFTTVQAALANPANWCNILILHINTKYCRASTHAAGAMIALGIGKKDLQALEDAHRMDLDYRVTASASDYVAIQLSADKGPVATSDYRIRLELAPLDSGRTFMHFTYGYAYGAAGRLAMQAYLATVASAKVGFTVLTTSADGRPVYVSGARGAVERNTMRYYLAIDAYLSALNAPAADQLATRLRNWFAATERYPRQLQEMERDEYIAMKQREVARQRTAQR